jgi:UDP-N-acetylglucosamine--N-acetylmuramyl-(pentapeptide) pyrophosphoryl-undecaprenol N-acetylglucosamine transferase
VKRLAKQPCAVLATGGSGGHIYPALAVAAALGARGYQVHFLGQKQGMEARLARKAGLSFHGLEAGKWTRGRPDPRQALRSLWGVGQAMRLLHRLKPDVVVGFGGFAGFPALAAARVLRVPIALHESNAFPGKVTRWFAPRAALIGVCHEEVAQHLPANAPLVQDGLPVREARVEKAVARRQLGLPETGLVTLVMGGSQGSLTLNYHVPRAFRALPETLREHLTVLHSSGPRWAESVSAGVAKLSGYRVEAYVDATLGWAAADLGITRAGMSTLAEAAFHGVPLIAVPLPSAAEDHQRMNALALQASGAGWMVEETGLGALAAVWRAMLEPETRRHAAAAALTASPEGAAERFAARIDRLVCGRQPKLTEARA